MQLMHNYDFLMPIPQIRQTDQFSHRQLREPQASMDDALKLCGLDGTRMNVEQVDPQKKDRLGTSFSFKSLISQLTSVNDGARN